MLNSDIADEGRSNSRGLGSRIINFPQVSGTRAAPLSHRRISTIVCQEMLRALPQDSE